MAKNIRPELIATFGDIFGELREDGFRYFYRDGSIIVSGLQDAAFQLNRSRSTLTQYCKDPTFPAEKDEDGWYFDLIACQDWILMNMGNTDGIKPIWPEYEENEARLMVVHVDDFHRCMGR